MPDNSSMIDRANAFLSENALSVRNSRYALAYHIAAPYGWINDPNGMVRMADEYHVFYP